LFGIDGLMSQEIKVYIDEALNNAGRSLLRVSVYADGELKGPPIPFRRKASPSEIALDLYEIGLIYSSKSTYPPYGEIYMKASAKVPGNT
jgi:hypothetical protein